MVGIGGKLGTAGTGQVNERVDSGGERREAGDSRDRVASGRAQEILLPADIIYYTGKTRGAAVPSVPWE